MATTRPLVVPVNSKGVDKLKRDLEEIANIVSRIGTVQVGENAGVNGLTKSLQRVIQLQNELNDKVTRNAKEEQEAVLETKKQYLDYRSEVKKAEQVQRDYGKAIKENEKSHRANAGSIKALIQENKVLIERLRNLPNALDKSNKAAERLRSTIRKNREEIDKFNKSLRDSPPSTFRQNLVKLGVTLASINIVLSRIGSATSAVVNAFSIFEQAEVNLSTLTGSLEKGNALFKELIELTIRTPFKLEETLTGAKRLLAFGIETEKVTKTLERLGNISAGVGREKLSSLILAYGQVRTATRLTGQELRQFTEAGVPLLELLAKQSGKTAGEIKDGMGKGVTVTFQEVESAIASATEEGGKFFKLMERQAQTLEGEISKLDDTFTIFLAGIGGKYEGLIKNVVTNVRSGLSQLTKLFDDDIDDIIKNVEVLQGAVRRSTDDFILQKSFLVEIAEIYPAILNNVKLTELSQKEQARLLKEQGDSIKEVNLGMLTSEERSKILEKRFKELDRTIRLDQLRKDLKELNEDIIEQEKIVLKDKQNVIKTFKELKEEDLKTSESLIKSAIKVNGAFASFSPVQDLEQSLRVLESLRKKAQEISSQISPPREIKREAVAPKETIIVTPKILEDIAKKFREIDTLSSQGLKTAESVGKDKLEIVKKFIIDSGVSLERAIEIFNGKVKQGVLVNKKDIEDLSTGLYEALNQNAINGAETRRIIEEKLVDQRVDLVTRGLERLTQLEQEYQARLDSINEFRSITQEEAISAELQELENLYAQKLILEQDYLNKKTALQKAQRELEQANQVKSIGFTSQILTNIGKVIGAESKKQFDIQKALNVASAIMNTYAGVNQALGKGNLIEAGVILSAGLANVAAIQRTRFGDKAASAGGGSLSAAANINFQDSRGVDLGSQESIFRQTSLANLSNSEQIISSITSLEETVSRIAEESRLDQLEGF